MGSFRPVVCAAFMIIACHLSNGQQPPRLNIPGAVLLPQNRPSGFRQARIQSDLGPPIRLRPRPQGPNALPAPVRPVIEENDEPADSPSSFDDEVSKLGISVLQSAVRQAVAPEESDTPRPLQFRPERPVPVLRDSIREQSASPRPLPVLRQELRENIPRQLVRPAEIREENIPVLRPQPIRQIQRAQPQAQPAPQVLRQQPRPVPIRQPSQFIDDEERPHNSRSRKPVVQILRKYRTDNADGSITWGYENEDGTFKEETLGIDCVTRGKYGYIDPDGVRREYKYETGNKCDEPEEEEEELTLQQGRQPQLQPQPQPRRPQPQLRPAQY